MSKNVVLTGVGRDRVGIVAHLTDALFGLGCNLLDSSMTLLRGEFAIILMVSLPPEISLEMLKEKLGKVQEQLGFVLHVRELDDSEANDTSDEKRGYLISVYGADKPGIVSGITHKLAQLNLNITDVETKRTSETQPVFIMVLEVSAPLNTVTEEITRELKASAKQLGVDISVQEWDVLEL